MKKSCVSDKVSEDLMVMNETEVESVSGGIPLVVAAYYAAGFVSGVAAGWTMGGVLHKHATHCK